MAIGDSFTDPRLSAECDQASEIEQLRAELAEKTRALSEASSALDRVDLMVDEFKRIRALVPSETEIAGLCNRAIAGAVQTVSVIEQRDEAEAVCAALRTRIAEGAEAEAGLAAQLADAIRERDEARGERDLCRALVSANGVSTLYAERDEAIRERDEARGRECVNCHIPLPAGDAACVECHQETLAHLAMLAPYAGACEKALLAIADDGWLAHGPEGMSEAQELCYAIVKPLAERRALEIGREDYEMNMARALARIRQIADFPNTPGADMLPVLMGRLETIWKIANGEAPAAPAQPEAPACSDPAPDATKSCPPDRVTRVVIGGDKGHAQCPSATACCACGAPGGEVGEKCRACCGGVIGRKP